MDYVSMLYTLLADWLVLHKLPSGLSLAGAAIILAASLIPLVWRDSHGGSGGPQAQQPSQQGSSGAASGGEEAGDKPLKASSSAEPEAEVQLVKLERYLGTKQPGGLMGGLWARCGGARRRASSRSSEREAVGLMGGGGGGRESGGGSGGGDGSAHWEIPAGTAAAGEGEGPQGLPGSGEGLLPSAAPADPGLLQAVVLGARVGRTSTEKETALLLAGK